jgi:hypothetical protein
MLIVSASARADNSQIAVDDFELQLIEDCASAVVVDHSIGTAEGMSSTSAKDGLTLQVSYVNDAPVAGITCTYTISGAGEAHPWDRNDCGTTGGACVADGRTATGPFTWIDVIMLPTG